jgi:NAD(P)-dependent dehydrogenase (short-subunit alcohol dehydrogenase family)
MREPQSIPRTALVTGAAYRIGRAIARDLAAHGYGVALHANRSAEAAAALAAEIAAEGGRAAVVQADLAETGRLPALVADAAAALGPLGVLVNCAALFEDDGARVDEAAMERHFRVNTLAPVLLADLCAAALPEGADGVVVNILDQRVLRLTPDHFSYGVSKSALWAATRMLAARLAPRVRVLGIGPGPVLPHEGLAPEDFAREVAATPLQHAPSLADFGRTIRYFVETPSLTGQMLALDAGQHLG